MRWILLLGLLLPGYVFAMDNGFHALSVSGGVAESSFSTSVFQNPAGIKNTPDFQFTGQAGGGDSFNNPFYRGGLIYGSKTYGVAAGVGHDTAGSGFTSAFFGFAAEITPLKTTVGLSGFTGLSPSGGTSYNLGVLIAPKEQYHLGFTAISVNNNVTEWGGGISLSLEQAVRLVVDATVDHNFNNLKVQPGIMLSSGSAGLTVSYGTSSGSLQLSDGFSAGGSLGLDKNLSFEAYYNHLAKIYLALSIKI